MIRPATARSESESHSVLDSSAADLTRAGEPIGSASWPVPTGDLVRVKSGCVVYEAVGSAQHTSIRFGEALAEAGVAGSVGTTGDSYDHALAETINGLYKTELSKPRNPWKSADDVEIATAEWVDQFNHRSLYEYCGEVPPAELEAAYYARFQHRNPWG